MKVCTGVDRNEGCESAQVRGKWKRIEAEAFYGLPFAEAMFRAQRVHRDNFDPNHVETASLLSIKTGAARKTAAIAQSAHYESVGESDPPDGSP